MRVLLDECVPRPLKRHLVGHDAKTVPEMGWAGKCNGALIDLMNAGGIDAFITIDRNVPHQQPLASAKFATIILKAVSNRLADLEPLVPQLLKALAQSEPGKVQTVS